MSRLPVDLRQSPTCDRGSELAHYSDVEARTEMPVSFCDLAARHEREHQPGTDLSIHPADDLARIAAILNRRHWPTLDLRTPDRALAELLAKPAAA
ncbi:MULTISPECIES: hypothetical protein [unclassified Nocardioides]|uniref:hypothetical protein n=1 Tax=Nocardioides sp. XL1 TaxID=2003120 RepID=UPI0011226E22|nr:MULTISPECIES: hypothetical protein [unclassified Nocardioides]